MKRKEIKTAVIGAAGTALNIIEQMVDARENYDHNIYPAGIIIDTYEKDNLINGIPVIGSLKEIPDLLNEQDLFFLFALYKPEKLKERFELLQSLKIPASRFVNFFHPQSYISKSFSYGTGNVILSNSTVQSNVKFGSFNIVNSNVTIEHDTTLGDGNFLAAGSVIGSNVSLGNSCFIGLNSSIRENVILGNNVYAGMQSAILNNYTEEIIAGIPAVPLKKRVI